MHEVTHWEHSIDIEGRVLVLEEVASTQDAALGHGLVAGDVCLALKQTDGRGRRGKSWDAKGGVALTVVLDHTKPHMAISIAGTLAAHLNNITPSHSIGIKWPNDLLVEGKKLAGILIEQRNSFYLVGVGVNVHCVPILDQGTTCLDDCGYTGDRLHVAQLVVSAVFTALGLDETTAITLWKQRDILIGSTQSIQSKGETYTGTVIDIVPKNHLMMQTGSGTITIDADNATVVTP